MPSDDSGRRAREDRTQDFSFRDDDDSRPSPNFPRDGNSRVNRNERTEQQRIVIDWDAVAGSFC